MFTLLTARPYLRGPRVMQLTMLAVAAKRLDDVRCRSIASVYEAQATCCGYRSTGQTDGRTDGHSTVSRRYVDDVAINVNQKFLTWLEYSRTITKSTKAQ